MISNFLFNPFRNTEISDKRLLKYADVGVERIRAAVGLPALVTGRLVPTDAAIASFRQWVQGGAQLGAKRLGQTGANDKAIRKFQKFAGQQAKVLGALYTDLDKNIKGENTPQFLQFFPKGVPALTEANKAAIDTEASVFIKAATDLAGDVGAALGTKAKALWKDVEDTRKAQLTSMGGEEDTQDARALARTALADVLFLNLLALLTHFYQTPDRVGDFFPEAILKENTGQQAVAAVPATTPA